MEERRFNVDFLDAVALTVTVFRGDVLTGAVMTWLVNLGDVIRDRTARQSRRQIRSLLDFEKVQARLLDVDGSVPDDVPPSSVAKSITEGARRVDYALWRLSNGELDLKALLPIVSAATGAVLSRRPLPTPLWLTLGMFAFNAFVALNERPSRSRGH